MGFAQKEKNSTDLNTECFVLGSFIFNFPNSRHVLRRKLPGSLWRQYDSVKDFKACKAFIRKK